jgi:multiple sugar transport system ATP-binding protein
MASLTVRDIRKSFGSVEVLKGINLEARSGEFVALVGPSGCGKSTLLAMIAGLETIGSGEIRIGDRTVNTVPPKDRNIAMVFQSYALYPTMTVRQNMLFGMEARKVPKPEREAALKRVSELLQIDQLLNRKPSQLSGGQRQRVAMGRALVRDPDLFLFDEPLSNLDAKLRVDMRMEIKKLHARVGKTTVYVTHDQVEAMTLASRIAVMHKGELQQFDEPQAIYDRPANLFVAGFMGSPSMNFLPATLGSSGGRSVVTIKGPGDSEIALPIRLAVSNLQSRQVILGIRPEHLSRAGPHGAGGEGQARLTLPVELVEPTGSETHAVLRLGDHDITARFAPAQAPKTGETVTLVVDMSKACLFDAATEVAIR